MSVKENKTITDHNLLAIQEAKLRLKKFKDQSPKNPQRSNVSQKGKEEQTTGFSIAKTLTVTSGKHSPESATEVGNRGGESPMLSNYKNSKAFENVIQMCCVPRGAKHYDSDIKNGMIRNREKGDSSRTENLVPMKRVGSMSLLQEDESPTTLKNKTTSSITTGASYQRGSHAIENEIFLTIQKHNSNYIRNRSSSNSKRVHGGDKSGLGELFQSKRDNVASFKNNASMNGYNSSVSGGGDPATDRNQNKAQKGKKQGQLFTSLKEMLKKGPLSKIGGSKAKKKRSIGDQPLYACQCKHEKKYKETDWTNKEGCIKSLGWLRSNNPPSAAHQELQSYCDIKLSVILPQSTIDAINKDVVRTFNNNSYLAMPESKDRLYKVLHAMACIYPYVSYVQGMNYIAATLLFHCDEYYSIGIFKILFEKLELKDVFLPSKVG